MWIEKHNALCNQYEFKDFKAAFAFMTQVALLAENLQHHPRWTNLWNKVEIELTTHDAGNIVTEKDKMMAQEIDNIYKYYEQNLK